MQLGCLFSLERIKEKIQKVKEMIHVSDKIFGLFELFNVLGTVLIIAHFCACLWYSVARLEMKSGEALT